MVNNSLEHVFHDKVSMEAGKINGEFVRYILPKKSIILTAHQKYWLRLEFKENEFRQSYGHSNVVPQGCTDRIGLLRDKQLANTAQIISRIVFVDS